jgi:hypothetical protein
MGESPVLLVLHSLRIPMQNRQGIRADVGFLADDALEGRGTAARGYEIAARYVAAQFEGTGLEPGGTDGTFFQHVPLRQGSPDETANELTVIREGREDSYAYRTDYLSFADLTRTDTSTEAPLVYVGSAVKTGTFETQESSELELKRRARVEGGTW